jgi:hypothetical protein
VDAHALGGAANGSLVRAPTHRSLSIQGLFASAARPLTAHHASPRPPAPQPLRTRFLVSVTSAPRALAAALAASLSSAVAGAPAASRHVLVPHAATDALVAADFRSATKFAYTLYVLNPAPPPRPYAYHYANLTKEDSSGGASSEMRFGCPGTLWVGRGRYAWVDLTAGPVSYGPRSGARVSDGVVTPDTFPRPAGPFSELLRAEADGDALGVPPAPPRTPSSRRGLSPAATRALVGALIGTLRSGAASLLAPPLAHAPVALWAHTEAALIRVSDVMEDTRRTTTASSPEGSNAGTGAGAVSGFDAETLRRELLSAQLGAASVSVSVRELSFGTCDLCGVAFAAARRTRAPAALHADGNGGGDGDAHKGEQQYLDSEVLHHWLVALLPAMQAAGTLRLSGIVPASGAARLAAHAPAGEKPKTEAQRAAAAAAADAAPPAPRRGGAFVPGGERRVLPLFLFDLSREASLLLDGEHTAVAFPDIVVAVRTRAGDVPLPAACASGAGALRDGDAVRVLHGGRGLTRPLLAAALTAGWGVAPPWDGWAAARGAAAEDHTWDVGHTPFGPLAASEELSFAPRDAAQRAVVASAVAAARTSAAAALAAFAALPGAAEALPRDAAARVAGRAGALRHKHARVAAALSAHQFDTAIYYARSAAHDAAGLEAALREAAAGLETVLECGGGGGGGLGLGGAAAAALAAAAAGWAAHAGALPCLRPAPRRSKQW